jgi:hypothetical protein
MKDKQISDIEKDIETKTSEVNDASEVNSGLER